MVKSLVTVDLQADCIRFSPVRSRDRPANGEFFSWFYPPDTAVRVALSKAVKKATRPETFGLSNSRGTICYINSVIQSLAACAPLKEYLLRQSHSSWCVRRLRHSYCGLCHFEFLMCVMWDMRGVSKCFKTLTVPPRYAHVLDRKALISLKPTLRPVAWGPKLKSLDLVQPFLRIVEKAALRPGALTRQEDASAFFVTFLDWLCTFEVPLTIPRPLDLSISGKLYTTALGQYFGFTAAIQREKACGAASSLSHQTSTNTYLEWPADAGWPRSFQDKAWPNKRKSHSLARLLELNMVQHDRPCADCQKTCCATEFRRLKRAPRCLVLRKAGGVPISLVEDPLDLSAFVDSEVEALYDLASVTVYIPNINRSRARLELGQTGGHYYALTKADEGRWLVCDDESVSTASPQEVERVLNPDAGFKGNYKAGHMYPNGFMNGHEGVLFFFVLRKEKDQRNFAEWRLDSGTTVAKESSKNDRLGRPMTVNLFADAADADFDIDSLSNISTKDTESPSPVYHEQSFRKRRRVSHTVFTQESRDMFDSSPSAWDDADEQLLQAKDAEEQLILPDTAVRCDHDKAYDRGKVKKVRSRYSHHRKRSFGQITQR
ncbi:MAG: hypothetical protein KVP17_004687 [Porospora cf. gigantea B]|uniref:uncharacterized protein n=1 Tax=Porospora cf. gigantea B TaxID=2853592 RepID=UPI003571AA7D|nr:MAG: hypothetical protein KVP17_004687 [Porospora cf. gigantea B]